MELFKHIARTLVLAAIYLLLLSRMSSAEFIYDIEGVFAPALSNPVSASFVGELTFPEDDVSLLTGWVELTNEPDIVREFQAEMAFNLPNYRLYGGTFGEEDMTMVLLDFDSLAGMNFLASELDGGGGWDAWTISFADYPAGSVGSMQAVNEPAGWALLAIGGVLFFGIARNFKGI